MLASSQLAELLQAVGELLEDQNTEIGIVVVGGASLNLMGYVLRPTNDIDVIATVQHEGVHRNIQLYPPPEPLPDASSGLSRLSRVIMAFLRIG